VPATGGTPEPVTNLDPGRNENSHRWPQFLPDGRHFLFTARSDVRENTGIYVGSLESAERKWLIEAQSEGAFVPRGHILYVRDATLMALAFDPGTLEIAGDARAIAGGIGHNPTGASADFAVSANGEVLVSRSRTEEGTELVWMDRSGVRGPTTALGETFGQARLAPDGKRAAVVLIDDQSGNRDIWLVELASSRQTRLTSHPANDWHPVWSPDGTQLIFASDRNGASAIFRRTIEAGDDQPVLESAGPDTGRFPIDWSRDSRFLTFHEDNPKTREDLWALPLAEGGKAMPVRRTPFMEGGGRISPDSRWVAYETDESGAREVYVTPLGRPGSPQRISIAGGGHPRWRPDGRELFFLSADFKLMVVTVNGGEKFQASTPMPLFDACVTRLPEHYSGAYEVAPDGQQTLWICPKPQESPSQATIAVNWAGDLAGS
jgi:Tol biopolymer transport system component